MESVLDALLFAAEQHKYQRRNGYAKLPYVNHLIKVVHILYHEGGERDDELLQAAILHDVVEDSDVTVEDLAERFSPGVAAVVGELTDDMSLPYARRRQLQIDGAAMLSLSAKKIRLVDKGANIKDLLTYPVGWTTARKRKYVATARTIVARLGCVSPALELWFEGVAAEADAAFGTAPDADREQDV